MGEEILEEIYKKIDWKLVIDMCCDPTGSNALVPLYFDAIVDSTM